MDSFAKYMNLTQKDFYSIEKAYSFFLFTTAVTSTKNGANNGPHYDYYIGFNDEWYKKKN